MWFSKPDPAKHGQKNVQIREGLFPQEYAFRGCFHAVVSGGEFPGPYALHAAKSPRIQSGRFSGPFCLYAAEQAEIRGGVFTGSMAAYGIQGASVEGGTFAGEYAFCESRDVAVAGGEFTGRGALSEARNARVRGGRFAGDDCGITSQGLVLQGGVYTGPGLLRSSLRPVVLGVETAGVEALAEAREVRVLTQGAIAHLGNVTSGIVAARRIGTLSPALTVSDDLLVLAEETGTPDPRVRLLPAGTILPQGDPRQAVAFLESLRDAHRPWATAQP